MAQFILTRNHKIVKEYETLRGAVNGYNRLIAEVENSVDSELVSIMNRHIGMWIENSESNEPLNYDKIRKEYKL